MSMAKSTPAKSTLPAIVELVGRDTLSTFMVEWVTPPMVPRDDEMVRHALVEASRRVTRAGAPVRCMRSTYRQSDDRWVCVFAAADEATIRRVHAIAQVPLTTVVKIM